MSKDDDHDNDNDTSSQQQQQQQLITKKRPLLKKQQILQQLPASYKQLLGQLGFCKWGKRHHPAAVLSPFQLPKKAAARQLWKKAFSKVQHSSDELANLPILVYWYGEPNLDYCYTLVPQRDFVSYKNATEKMRAYGLKAQRKHEAGVERLTKAEERRLEAMQEWQTDLDQMLMQQEQKQEQEESDSNKKRSASDSSSQSTKPKTNKPQLPLNSSSSSSTEEPSAASSLKIFPACTESHEEKEQQDREQDPDVKKRPRGRPPLGKVWDPVHGVYISDGSYVPDPDEEEEEQPPPPPRKKKSKKRPRSEQSPLRKAKTPGRKKSSCKRRQSSSSPGRTKSEKKSELMEKMLEAARKDAKAELEREKSDVMKRLPESVLQKFGQVGFCKWGKNFLPALVLNPHHVPPGPVRDLWLDAYRDFIQQGRPLERIMLLVFWYGEKDVDNYYSMVTPSAFCPYEQATDKMLDYALKAETRLAQGKRLTKDEAQKLRAMQELEEDLHKEPGDRQRGVVQFQERHDLLTLSDMEDIDCDTDDEGDLESVYDDGYSSLEDSESDLNDDRECLSSDSSDDEPDEDDDDDDDADIEFVGQDEEDEEERDAVLDDSSGEKKKKSKKKKKKQKKKMKEDSTKKENTESTSSTENTSNTESDNVETSNKMEEDNDTKQPALSCASSPKRTESPTANNDSDNQPPLKKRKSVEAPKVAAAATHKVIPDDEDDFGLVDSEDEREEQRSNKSRSKVPRRVYVEQEEEDQQSELHVDSDADAITEDDPSTIASAPKSALMTTSSSLAISGKPNRATKRATGETKTVSSSDTIRSSSVATYEAPPNLEISADLASCSGISLEKLQAVLPLAAVAASGQEVTPNNPVFAVYNQIVQKVCHERDVALQKVQTLEALLEEKQKLDAKPAAAEGEANTNTNLLQTKKKKKKCRPNPTV